RWDRLAPERARQHAAAGCHRGATARRGHYNRADHARDAKHAHADRARQRRDAAGSALHAPLAQAVNAAPQTYGQSVRQSMTGEQFGSNEQFCNALLTQTCMVVMASLRHVTQVGPGWAPPHKSVHCELQTAPTAQAHSLKSSMTSAL